MKKFEYQIMRDFQKRFMMIVLRLLCILVSQLVMKWKVPESEVLEDLERAIDLIHDVEMTSPVPHHYVGRSSRIKTSLAIEHYKEN